MCVGGGGGAGNRYVLKCSAFVHIQATFPHLYEVWNSPKIMGEGGGGGGGI